MFIIDLSDFKNLASLKKGMSTTEIGNSIVCERCKQPFICDPTNIGACNCTKIKLSEEERNYISKQYSDCVCNSCLLILKDKFLIQK